MSYECIHCNFSAPTSTRLKRHLSTQKHIRIFSLYQAQHQDLDNIQIQEDNVQEPLNQDLDIIQIQEIQEDNNVQEPLNQDLDIIQIQEIQEDNNVQETLNQVLDNIQIQEIQEDNVQETLNQVLYNDYEEEDNYWSDEEDSVHEGGEVCDEEENDINNNVLNKSVQEEDDNEKNEQENDEKNDYFNFLDIQTIIMINNMNELITSHPFIIRMMSIFMNILCFIRGSEPPH